MNAALITLIALCWFAKDRQLPQPDRPVDRLLPPVLGLLRTDRRAGDHYLRVHLHCVGEVVTLTGLRLRLLDSSQMEPVTVEDAQGAGQKASRSFGF